MMQLLKKDWRVNRTAIFWIFALLMSLTLLNWIGFLDDWRRTDPLHSSYYLWSYISQALEGSAIESVYAAAAMAAVLGGMSFAHERHDRSADFLAMLPIQKSTALISKIIVNAVVLACTFGLILAIHTTARGVAARAHNNFGIAPGPPAMDTYGQIVALWLVLFGIAWLLSTFLRIPSLCAGISIAITVMCPIILYDILAPHNHDSRNDSEIVMQYFGVIAACSGFVCFLAGSIYYLKRVEP